MPALYEFNSVEENIALAKELKLDFIELNLNFSYCRKAILNIEYLDNLLKENQLDATLHFFDEADFGSYDEIRNQYITMFEETLKEASKSPRIKQINVHLNYGPLVTITGKKYYIYEKEYNEFFPRLVDSLRRLKDITSSYNIGLVIENVALPPFLQNTYLALNSLGFNFCFDIGHDFVDHGHLFELSKHNDFNFHEFHIHNSDSFKNHLPLNQGIININYYKRLALTHDAYIVIEVKNVNDLKTSVPIFKNI
jgi:sugar phosphate isomerase/epimerase